MYDTWLGANAGLRQFKAAGSGYFALLISGPLVRDAGRDSENG